MTTPTSASSSQADPDTLLSRLQDNYTRQKRLVAAQKRKQADIEIQAAAAYYSDLPVTLELLSDQTAALFTEMEHLMVAQQEHSAIASREVLLLQRIRAAVNKELRQSLSYIEDGYQSGFEKMMKSSRGMGQSTTLSAAPDASTSLSRPPFAGVPRAAAQAPGSPSHPGKSKLTVREALSEHLSLVAESISVLLQCEVVRIYLFDEHENLRCAAQFPYRACRADPMQSNSLSLMTVREVHQTVCRNQLAVNGTLNAPGTTSALSASPQVKDDGSMYAGIEEIRSCLIFPLLAPNGARTAFGMVHAVNKHLPGVVDGAERGNTDLPLRGFNLEDEVLLSNAARLLGTTLSRYPREAFTCPTIGELVRRRAHPGDPEVSSLSAHLLPALHEDIAEAAEVGQEALNRTLPTLVYRAPVDSIFASRASGEGRRSNAAAAGVDNESSVSTVAFRLRCMNELWASCREDNAALHQQYRTLEEETQRSRLLLRNLLDGVATARFMGVSADVEQYLQTLEVYGRSARNERMADFVAETMLALTQCHPEGTAGDSAREGSEATSSLYQSCHTAQSTVELRRLLRDHARLNTVTVASLHFDGPDGVPSYTSAPVQKREQVRFIDELRRSGAETVPQPKGTALRYKGNVGNGGGAHSTSASLPRLAASSGTTRKSAYPFQRPFKL